MAISDNGKGMPESKAQEGIGLRNIRGRLSTLNGKAFIATGGGKGFTLEIQIPL